jgi:cbb3-type cytochrome oxidase maturation protein
MTMNIIAILLPLALALGLAGLGAFFWCMRTGQFADLEGAGWRVLRDDDLASRNDAACGGEGESRAP